MYLPRWNHKASFSLEFHSQPKRCFWKFWSLKHCEILQHVWETGRIAGALQHGRSDLEPITCEQHHARNRPHSLCPLRIPAIGLYSHYSLPEQNTPQQLLLQKYCNLRWERAEPNPPHNILPSMCHKHGVGARTRLIRCGVINLNPIKHF